jgi:cytochrome P450
MTRTIADLPGPSRLPMLGNLHQVRIGRLHSQVEEWCERYGPLFRLDLGPRQVVVVGDLAEINRIMRERPDGYRRWREIKSVSDELGASGVFHEEGEDWRRQRRLTVTALNSNHLHRYFHVIQTATDRLHRRLRDAADGRSVDIVEELASFALDVGAALAFGHDLNTLERRDSELQAHLKRVFEMTMRRVFAPVPYWRWVKLPADRALDRSLVEVHSAVNNFIEQARARMDSRPELWEEPENFLESMLADQRADSSFTDKEIVGNVFTLLLAGEDTTSNTMAWTIWLLSTRADIQQRWSREACEVLGDRPFPEEYDTIERLHYGEAVLRESMRLKPVAPILNLEPLHDTTIADTQIPAGTGVILLDRLAGLQAVERASEFDPDRWLTKDDETSVAPDQKSFLAFGGGPRFCPGRNLAFLESKTAMAMLARNFELELDESSGPVSELLSFTMIPKGLRVRLRERTRERPVLV